jgi:hypothetical protein
VQTGEPSEAPEAGGLFLLARDAAEIEEHRASGQRLRDRSHETRRRGPEKDDAAARVAVEIASQDREKLGEPLRFVDDDLVLLRKGEERIEGKPRLVARILEIEECVVREREPREGRLADLPRAEEDRGRSALADGAEALGGDSRPRHDRASLAN